MYVLLKGEEGEHLRIGPALEMVVLEISPRGIKFGLIEPAGSQGQPPVPPLPEPVAGGSQRSALHGYYRFLRGGQRLFIFTRAEGECLWNDGTLEIVVLQREGRSVVLGCRRLTSGPRRAAVSPRTPAFSPYPSRSTATILPVGA